MRKLFNDGSTVPTAFVTRGRQRVKQYSGHGNGIVYLNNGDEFEIELFNPTTSKVLATIELNGFSIGNSGIVLRPGERVFLERYLDDARKFLFETYEVDKNNDAAIKAIANNGNVVIEFFNEQHNVATITYTGGVPWTSTWPPFSDPFKYTCQSANFHGMTSNESNCFYSSASPSASLGDRTRSASKSIETGRVEKGANSNQSFVYDNSSFNTFSSWKTEWKILPLSQKPIESKDLKVFCTQCGAKQKRHTHKFCPICGTKY